MINPNILYKESIPGVNHVGEIDLEKEITIACGKSVQDGAYTWPLMPDQSIRITCQDCLVQIYQGYTFLGDLLNRNNFKKENG